MQAIKEKRPSFPAAKVPTAIKLEGGGVMTLLALPLKKKTFCGFSISPSVLLVIHKYDFNLNDDKIITHTVV